MIPVHKYKQIPEEDVIPYIAMLHYKFDKKHRTILYFLQNAPRTIIQLIPFF